MNINNLKEQYIIFLVILLGIFAGISALLIAWPALAYLGAYLVG